MDKINKGLIDNLAKLSPFIASVLIPLAIALIGNWISLSIKDKENGIKMIEIASAILESNPEPEKENMRKWAISVINKHSSVPIPDDLNKDFLSFRLPSLLKTGKNFLDDTSNPISYAASKGADSFRQSLLLAENDKSEEDEAILRAKRLLRIIIEENIEKNLKASNTEQQLSKTSPDLKLLIKIGFADSYRKHLGTLYSVYLKSVQTGDRDSALNRLNKGVELSESSHSILMGIFEKTRKET